MKIIRFYKTKNGSEPFKEWLDGLKDIVAVGQINARVRRLTLGLPGDVEPVAKGVFEMKIHFGPGYRVYFSEIGREVVILLLGGDKGSQKRDIRKAESYWNDYQEQHNEKK